MVTVGAPASREFSTQTQTSRTSAVTALHTSSSPITTITTTHMQTEENTEGDLQLQPHPAFINAGNVGPGTYQNISTRFGSGKGQDWSNLHRNHKHPPMIRLKSATLYLASRRFKPLFSPAVYALLYV
jgi:hypothetical protein